MAAINAGKRAASPDGLSAVLWAAEEAYGHRLDLVFVSECDSIRGTRHEVEVEEWRVFRHWPGEGSLAMSWCVRLSCASRMCAIAAGGRSLSVDILNAGASADGSRIRFVGGHGPHVHREYADFLSEVCQLVGAPPRRLRVIAVGDWNADPRPGHATHEQVVSLSRALGGVGLSRQVARPPERGPGGPHEEECRTASVTRIPIGACADRTRPSQLDYFLSCSSDLVELRISWALAPAHHAFVIATVPAGGAPKRPPRTWRPVSGEGWKAHLTAAMLGDSELPRPESVQALSAVLSMCAERWRDRRTTRMRRRDRVPCQARAAWRRASDSASEGRRGLLQQQGR